MSEKNLRTLKSILFELGENREVGFDGKRYNSKHLYNLLEKWHDSEAYTTDKGIKFDSGNGVFAYIKTEKMEMLG